MPQHLKIAAAALLKLAKLDRAGILISKSSDSWILESLDFDDVHNEILLDN